MILLTEIINIPRIAPNHDWLTLFLMGTICLMIIGNLLFTRNFGALANINTYMEIKDNQFLFSILAHILFSVLLVVFIFPNTSLNLIPYEFSDFQKAVFMVCIILSYFFLRFFISGLVYYAFDIKNSISITNNVSAYFRIYSAIILFIGILLYNYSFLSKKIILISCFSFIIISRIAALIYKYKYQRPDIKNFWYYNILYLCSLEILPILVLFKFLTDW